MSAMLRTIRTLLTRDAGRAGATFRIVFADGRTCRSREGEPSFTLVFRNRRAEWRTAVFRHVGLLESYFAGDVDIEGNLQLAFRTGMDMGLDGPPAGLLRLRNAWHEVRFGNASLAQAKANARFHYGLGTDFYRQWLDLPSMMYTCGYWKEGTQTVEEAQRNKMDHVAQKIRLEAGERFVDIGCGFGGFLFHAREHYGAYGTGINTTTEQVQWLQGEIARRGLGEQIAVIEADFREIPGQYDKLVSIGVLEHAGRDQLHAVVRAHADALKPGGLGMLHFIGHAGVFDTEFYIRKHIFPGGWIPSLAQTIEAMDACGLEIVDIENLRRHYALTLDAWATRFDARWDAIHALDPQRFDERFRRTWRTYLWSCAEMFRSPCGMTHLFQIVFSKGNVDRERYPMSRAFLYR
ncbi:cyclopropane-fatty-acyl-phospholipid synthase family protein [Thiobacillus sedimenti]|uniref:Cyclopropane-fatty-acyl-phospholipid synthase family protein n=1 Tax=Thiobacillus sedimenti TaxID=3110231 RepID=A0ABZ1CLS9_9PROT|nr:cyclopropane-fatty-acyl-phospholipid synthase family protein [Thiobacillus sp. SCUT-2]WRS40221.1 cyclopropane-fatty-acyl-phospholipid synthase family protein [Thiobacillus sp. SCUT-2]